MTDFIPQTISALIQILIFLLIPFIWWLVTARRTEPFFRWLGWKRPRVTHPGRLALVIIGTLVVAGAVGVLFISAAADVSPSPLTGLGFAGLGAAIVYAVAQTAFAEESLFRGFLLKRIAARFGFWTGNVVQAVLFGLVHMVPFLLLGMSPSSAWTPASTPPRSASSWAGSTSGRPAARSCRAGSSTPWPTSSPPASPCSSSAEGCGSSSTGFSTAAPSSCATGGGEIALGFARSRARVRRQRGTVTTAVPPP